MGSEADWPRQLERMVLARSHCPMSDTQKRSSSSLNSTPEPKPGLGDRLSARE